VSPARARTSNDAVVAAGRELLEAGGLDALTMQAVAARLGIRAPSLYKRFVNRSALIAAIAEAAIDEQGRELAGAIRGDDPGADLRRMAEAYRSFAKRAPNAYQLTFTNLVPEARPPVEASARAAAPLIATTGRLVGADRALEAARLVTAFVHGFLSMEIAGAFRLGGDVDAAYRFGVDTLLRGLSEAAGVSRAEPSEG
jgi:AcrR family transcriptional regulator